MTNTELKQEKNISYHEQKFDFQAPTIHWSGNVYDVWNAEKAYSISLSTWRPFWPVNENVDVSFPLERNKKIFYDQIG